MRGFGVEHRFRRGLTFQFKTFIPSDRYEVIPKTVVPEYKISVIASGGVSHTAREFLSKKVF